LKETTTTTPIVIITGASSGIGKGFAEQQTPDGAVKRHADTKALGLQSSSLAQAGTKRILAGYPQQEAPMTLCPIALAVGCKKCPVFAVCPVKSVIGDQPAADAKPVASPPSKAKKSK
jgi:NAD(P)-dependent dehydrogenase (short-subunit alcohol dehydrogenase family)